MITILASDEASGIISFDSDKEVIINEPSAENSIPSVENSVARLQLQRAPGIFGAVNVPFIIVPETQGQGQDEGQVVDLTPAVGVIIFQDRQVGCFSM